MTTRTRFRSVVTLAAAALLTLAGCGSGASSNSDSGLITLQFVGEEPMESFKPALDAFQAKYPNIKVVYNSVPYANLNDTIQARMSGKDSSMDVYMADEPRIPSIATKGYAVKYPGDTAGLSAALDPKALEAASFDGKVWALPLWSSSQVLYYNKVLLAKANVTPPGADPQQRWTWEQLITAAQATQKAGAKWGFSFQQVDRYYQLQTLPESLGGGPGLSGPDLLTPALNNDGWLKAMRWYHSTFDSKVSPRGVAVGDIPALFTGGQLAFMVGTPVYVSQFAGTAGLQWGVAPQPYFAGGKAYTPTDGWALAVSPYSKHQDAAWKFVQFLTLDQQGSASTIAGRPFPSANKATEQLYLQKLPDLAGGNAPQISTLLSYELTNTAIHRPRTIGYIEFETVMNKAFADIRNGSDPKQRLSQASDELKTAFARLPK